MHIYIYRYSEREEFSATFSLFGGGSEIFQGSAQI